MLRRLSAPRAVWRGLLVSTSSTLMLSSVLLACASVVSPTPTAQAVLIPPDVSHVQIDNNAAPGAQQVTFMTSQTAQVILDFYRAELPLRGWSLSCSTTTIQGPCSSNITLRDEDAHDVYHRTEDRYGQGPSFEVIIEQETLPQTFVEVYDQWTYANKRRR